MERASDGMDAWDPSFLTGLSSNHTVITIDQRGIANTTVGSKPYTPEQLANDTAGLLDALNRAIFPQFEPLLYL